MTVHGDILWLLLLLPALAALASLLLPSAGAVLRFVAWGMPVVAGLGGWTALQVLRLGDPLASRGQWLCLDALGACHLLVLLLVFTLSSLFVLPYFCGSGTPTLSLRCARRFAGLWYGSSGAMTLVLLSNNLGIMWVGVEASTLLTAFLVCLHVSPVSLEATWKYLIVCSVGVAFAFMGVLLMAAAAAADVPEPQLLNWTHLRAVAASLDPRLAKLAFIFVLVGYGTKAGLAPMHSWLPDAHSQAPAPVSALFSGAMLNVALYGIMRYVPLVDAALGTAGWTQNLLLIFGLSSIVLAAVFILAQRDLKRLLAYCSVEHIGIITLGLGLGPAGAFAALLHTLNHALSKAFAFFSAGRLGQVYGISDMGEIRGAVKADPLWGSALLGSLLALVGVAPFGLFISELLLLRAALGQGRYLVAGIFLFGCSTAFIGILRHALEMGFGEPPAQISGRRRSGLPEWILVVAVLLALLLLGLWLPPPLCRALEAAAATVSGGAR